jgi:hypothetical protein
LIAIPFKISVDAPERSDRRPLGIEAIRDLDEVVEGIRGEGGTSEKTVLNEQPVGWL